MEYKLACVSDNSSSNITRPYNQEHSPVVSIEVTKEKRGIFAPLTSRGSIVAEGVLASCFVQSAETPSRALLHKAFADGARSDMVETTTNWLRVWIFDEGEVDSKEEH